MNDFETTLMIDKIKSQKYGKDLVEDIITIRDWYYIGTPFPGSNGSGALICNAYKCLTLAISLYITKCSSPLPIYVYRMKHGMEGKILSEEFLNTDKPTYEWLIDTFQYTVNIPANTPNSTYTQDSGKQVGVRYNIDYVVFNKLALLIKDKTIPFTVNYYLKLSEYHRNLIPGIIESPQQIMRELVLIQTLKAKADSNITYTLFEEALDEKLRKLLSFKVPLSFMETAEPLHESVRAMEILNLKYLKIKEKEDE
ncbi:MAG: hypothetical protein LR001_09255 [Clostridiales bacterium]|nr:hypothetical protein [Clostridiales bacterium]